MKKENHAEIGMARGRTLCRALAVLRDVLYARSHGPQAAIQIAPGPIGPDQVVAELYNVREYASSARDLAGPGRHCDRLWPRADRALRLLVLREKRAKLAAARERAGVRVFQGS